MTESIIKQYKILEKLGAGNYAEVFKAENLETKETVAIKKMKKMTKADKEMVTKEINIMKSLKHKNIVQYKTDFRHNGEWYIVLEYCGKGDMEKYKEKVGKIPEHHCKLFVRGILQALVELHSRKIAHRDLKLANILINDKYQLKLADFGFSKDYEEGWMKSFCGTPLSMSPQILRREQYNETCDVWSLGILTYMMLYNRPPYYPLKSDGTGLGGMANAVTNRQHRFDERTPVSDVGKDFINQCLIKKIFQRPPSQTLLKHPWFVMEDSNLNRISLIRQKVFSQSFKDTPENEAIKTCKIMLFGVFEEHLLKIAEAMLIGSKNIKATIQKLNKMYEDNEQIRAYYLLQVIKKLQELNNRQIIFILLEKSIKIQLKKIQKFGDFLKEANHLVKEQLSQLKSISDKVNIEKQLIKFLMNETELIMESSNETEVNEKMTLFQDVCKFVITDYENTIINVKWGEREDMKKISPYVKDYLENLQDQAVINIINEEMSNNEDLESIWLIQNQIKESTKQKKCIEIQLGKLVLYILNIPSNFTVDKTMQTDKLQLAYQQLLLS